MKSVSNPRRPNPPPPPPPRTMKESFFGGMYETKESRQATADWYKTIGRPPPVEYRGEVTEYSYFVAWIVVVLIGVAVASALYTVYTP